MQITSFKGMELHVHHERLQQVADAPELISTSESLAHGLVTKMTRGARACTEQLRKNTPEPRSTKRAAAFREMRELIRNFIPAHLRAMEVHFGDRTGKSKNALFLMAHWESAASFIRIEDLPPQYVDDDLVLMTTSVWARRLECVTVPTVAVSRHAMMRLFYRLKTADESLVLNELGDLVSAMLQGSNISDKVGEQAHLLIPSSQGAFVVTRNRVHKAELYTKTWLSDSLMAEDSLKLEAVVQARKEQGAVLSIPGYYPILSEKRLRALGANDMLAITSEHLNTLCEDAFQAYPHLMEPCMFRPVDTFPSDDRYLNANSARKSEATQPDARKAQAYERRKGLRQINA